MSKKTESAKNKVAHSSKTESNTRKKTNPEDYALEQNFNNRVFDYYGNPDNYFRRTTHAMLPGNGIVGAAMSNFDLANNACDIESMLWGHGSGNMVNRTEPIQPDFKRLPTLNMFDSKSTYMPDPMVVHRGQRPLFK